MMIYYSARVVPLCLKYYDLQTLSRINIDGVEDIVDLHFHRNIWIVFLNSSVLIVILNQYISIRLKE